MECTHLSSGMSCAFFSSPKTQMTLANKCSLSLGEQPLRVAREHAGLSDVVQAQEEHDYALQANTSSSMGKGAMLETVHIGLDSGHLSALGLGLHKEGERMSTERFRGGKGRK